MTVTIHMYCCDRHYAHVCCDRYYAHVCCDHYYANVLLWLLLCTCITVAVTLHMYIVPLLCSCIVVTVTMYMYYCDCYYALVLL